MNRCARVKTPWQPQPLFPSQCRQPAVAEKRTLREFRSGGSVMDRRKDELVRRANIAKYVVYYRSTRGERNMWLSQLGNFLPAPLHRKSEERLLGLSKKALFF